MSKTTKYLLLIGGTLSILALMLFSFLSRQHSVLSADYPVIYLSLLIILFLAYFGPPIFLSGALLWSFGKGKVVKILVWSALALVFIAFVPFPSECRKTSNDTAICFPVFPLQKQYWILARGSMEDQKIQKDARWHNVGMNLFIKEGYGDIWNEIKKAGERI
ncbi:MAG: hypothetical protein WC878_05885 [Candidatus Paceibacterota bacterium]|jgi:hypothetical protein